MDYIFPPRPAVDPLTGELAKNASLTPYAPSDTGFTTPLTIKDTSGLPVSVVRTNYLGLTETVTSEDEPVLILKDGSFTTSIESPTGMLAAAWAAQVAAEAALAAIGDGSGVAGVSSVNGRSGAVSLTSADVGLESVNNTSDAAKPVSDAQQAALDGKAGTAHTHTQGQVSGLTASLAAKMGINGPVPIGAISATGTPTASKFLRGDGVWAEPASAIEIEYTGTEWPARPVTSRSVTFVSTKHPGAPLPNDMVIGDRIIEAP